ncbi:MAG: TIGR01212 family radical SAM protein [Candidatus Egerieousia sp.]
MQTPSQYRYNAFVEYFKEKYGCRLQKVVVNAGFGCPNIGGCTYCDNDAFHPGYSTPDKPILRQIDEGIEFHKVRYRRAQRYIAYFQPHSNTFAPIDRLKRLYGEALRHPEIEGIVIGTRPDCIDEEKLDYLQELQRSKIVIIEYGIESCYDRTLERINRGHDFECARKAVEMTAERGITQCAHFIFGLPGETLDEMMATSEMINTLPLTAVKFHQLQIIKGTRMEQEFACKRSEFHEFDMDGYLSFIGEFLRRLRPDLYIDRFAGEVPPRFISPLQKSWGLVRYSELIRMLEERMEKLDIRQGDFYKNN